MLGLSKKKTEVIETKMFLQPKIALQGCLCVMSSKGYAGLKAGGCWHVLMDSQFDLSWPVLKILMKDSTHRHIQSTFLGEGARHAGGKAINGCRLRGKLLIAALMARALLLGLRCPVPYTSPL